MEQGKVVDEKIQPFISLSTLFIGILQYNTLYLQMTTTWYLIVGINMIYILSLYSQLNRKQ